MIVVDTGPLVAAIDADDDDHHACAAFLERHADELVVPATVVVEVCWLIARTVGVAGEAALLQSIADSELKVEDITEADYRRAGELIVAYGDMDLGIVDATVVAVAERLDVTSIATLDHRDFRVVRPRHTSAFTLLP